MKVNFNQTFKTFDGEVLTIDGQPQVMYQVIAQALFNGQGIKESQDPVKDNNKKMQAYALCMRLVNGKGHVDISTDEAVLIKEAVQKLTPGCYAQVVNLIEG